MRSKVTASAVPAARSDDLLIEPVGDETVIYDTRSKEAHCLKPLAAIVFGCSDGRATVGEIAKLAEQRLGDAVSDADVADAVAQLESLDLLQTPLVVRGRRSPRGDQRRWRLAPRDAPPRRVRRCGHGRRHVARDEHRRAERVRGCRGSRRAAPAARANPRLSLEALLPGQPGQVLQPELLRGAEQLVSYHRLRLPASVVPAVSREPAGPPRGSASAPAPSALPRSSADVCPTCPAGSSSCCSTSATICSAPTLSGAGPQPA